MSSLPPDEPDDDDLPPRPRRRRRRDEDDDDYDISARSRGGRDDSELTSTDWVIAVLCSGIGCIMGIVWLIQGKPKGGKMVGVSILFSILWTIVRVVITAGINGGNMR